MRMNRFGGDRGFTLIELLIVIAIIGFLAAAILVAVDPVKRVNQARNAKRWAESNAVLNAILKKQVDARAAFSGDASAPIVADATNVQVIVSDLTGINCTAPGTQPYCNGATMSTATQYGCVAKIDALVDDPTDSTSYLAEISVDPLGAGEEPDGASYLDLGDYNTGYYIHKFPNGRIEVGACYPDEGETIRVKR